MTELWEMTLFPVLWSLNVYFIHTSAGSKVQSWHAITWQRNSSHPTSPSRCLRCSEQRESAGLNVGKEALLKAPGPISLLQMHMVSWRFHANRHLLFKQFRGYPQEEACPSRLLLISYFWNHQSCDVPGWRRHWDDLPTLEAPWQPFSPLKVFHFNARMRFLPSILGFLQYDCQTPPNVFINCSSECPLLCVILLLIDYFCVFFPLLLSTDIYSAK